MIITLNKTHADALLAALCGGHSSFVDQFALCDPIFNATEKIDQSGHQVLCKLMKKGLQLPLLQNIDSVTQSFNTSINVLRRCFTVTQSYVLQMKVVTHYTFGYKMCY